MQNQKTRNWITDPQWPVNSVPQNWVEALFEAMSANYGSRFADLWRGTDIATVKRNWGIEIAKLSREQLKAGRENLALLLKAPTCPEFVAHCRQCRSAQAASTAPRLEDSRPADAETVKANLGQLSDAQRRMMRPELTAEWAFRLVMSGKASSGIPLTLGARRCATDAITSPAGARVVENCINPELKKQYADLRRVVMDGYRASGEKVWNIIN